VSTAARAQYSAGEDGAGENGAGENSAGQWEQRVGSGDWDAITAEVSEYGGALLPRLLTDAETEALRSCCWSSGPERSRAAPPRSCHAGTGTCSRRGTGRSVRSGGGQRPRCDTESR